jgi:lysophospholipase L1-like esterase
MRSLVGGWLGRPSYPRYVNSHVLSTNTWLRDLARREGLLLLDAQPILSAPNGLRLREYAANDGSHVSASGYEALTRYVTPLLEAHLRAR